MQLIDNLVASIDQIQRRYRPFSFIFAVIKKYGDDQIGYQAALLTYYAFLALFPLLLVLTTIAGIVANNDPHLRDTIIRSMTQYFPVLGTQLSEHITTLHKSGIALVLGIVFTLYGARGVADVFRRGVMHIWHEPMPQDEAFPKRLGKNLSIMLVGGLGLLAASVVSGIASAAGHGFLFRGLSITVNLLVLFALFNYLIDTCLPHHVPLKDTRAGAAVAAIGLIILQSLGGYVLRRELKSLDALYSYFAISLGLLFWIYLQAQLLYYSITIAAVKTKKLFPRSLSGKNLTTVDKKLSANTKAQPAIEL
ncbi:MAG: YihY/virulence factor BrkB family protein [Patescibacteria group bacterium]|nr:YihY/virulence factor BrkB family protein [Patescibacteria group bacterium]